MSWNKADLFNYKTINKSTRYSVGHQVKEICCHPSTNLNKYHDNPSNIYSKKAIFSLSHFPLIIKFSCLHFFSSFFLYSVLQQWFPPFCLPGHFQVYSSASIILLLIPSSVLFISVCLFFSSSKSLVNISHIFSILFPRFCLIFTIIFWIIFLEGCLSPLYLVVFLGFYLVLSSRT